MTTTSARREQLIASLRDKEDRDIFVEEEIKTGVPFQIRALRKDRGWSQREFAKRIGMTQEGVSRLENPNYGKFTFTTLLRLASAFDVGLAVRFAPFSELVDWVVNLDPEDLAVPDFEHDPGIAPPDWQFHTAQTADAMPQLRKEPKPVTDPVHVPTNRDESPLKLVWRRDPEFTAERVSERVEHTAETRSA